MSTLYRHTQFAYLLPGILGGAILLILLLQPITATTLVAVAAMAAIGLYFSSLTITVDEAQLTWQLGRGFLRKSVPLSDIVRVEAMRTAWYYGWGIRYTPHGWLHNVSGFDAVKIYLRGGKTFLLGTDEPDALVEVLQRATRPKRRR